MNILKKFHVLVFTINIVWGFIDLSDFRNNYKNKRFDLYFLFHLQYTFQNWPFSHKLNLFKITFQIQLIIIITLFSTTYFNFQTTEINLYILTHLNQKLTEQIFGNSKHVLSHPSFNYTYVFNHFTIENLVKINLNNIFNHIQLI